MNRLVFALVVTGATAHAQPIKLPPQPTLTSEAAAIVGDARFVSYQTEDEKTAPDYTLHIVKLSKAGHTLVSSTRIESDGHQTWIDPRTLASVSIDTDKKTYALSYFVDGVLDPKRNVTGALVWKAPKGAEVPPYADGYRGRRGELFLRSCIDVEGDIECKKPLWMRIDGPKPGPMAAPKGVVPFSAPHAKEPAVKGPKDVTVKITKIAATLEKKKIPAIACTKNGATTTWSYESMIDSGEQFYPRSTSWVLLDPPIYSATGLHSNPVAVESIRTYHFRACEPREMGNFHWHAGLWETHADGSIKLFAGKDPVAVFVGRELRSAPQPPASGDKR
jgi:hypothetical protein